jgi:signal transduction histidine kinase
MVGRLLIRRFLLLAAASALPHAGYSWDPEEQRHSLKPSYTAFKRTRVPGGAAGHPHDCPIVPMGIGLSCGLAAMIPMGIWCHMRQKRRLREQRELLGDELHDQLGPMIYYSRMLLTSELQKTAEPSTSLSELQNQLAQTGETVRDLSKTLRQDGATTLAALEAFLGMNLERWRQSGSAADFVVHGTIPHLVLSLAQYTQLLRVLQELMLNSCRHAAGNPIHLAFECKKCRLQIKYWDEGAGFAPGISTGTGTCSTLARMKRIGGTIKVDNRYPKGFEILITLPL